MRRSAAAWRAVLAASLVAALAGTGLTRDFSPAVAQTIDVQRARTLVVGAPRGGARMDRVDAARTGRTREPLPSSGLRTEWRASLGALVEHPPLVDAEGVTYVVGTRGEVTAVGRDGAERWHAASGAMQPGPAALLADDSVVFVDAAGEAVAVRAGAVRWRVRFGRSDAERPAPLPLADGGAVVATTNDLAALDADGHLRARVTLAEPTTVPLVAALGKVVAVGVSGTVWTWTPGAPEATRAAGFGSPISDGAALADEHTLVAVSGGLTRLLAVDLGRGTAATRTVATVAPVAAAALFLGPPAMRGETAYLMVTAPTSELAVAFDASGAEIARTMLATHPPPIGPDGGAGVLVAAPHTPPLVDADGRIAFATPDGSVGVANASGSELMADACPPATAAAGRVPPVAGLAPLGAGAFVAACASGTLLAVRGASGGPGAPHLYSTQER
jgi:outer membrane protein assembly factor BamB